MIEDNTGIKGRIALYKQYHELSDEIQDIEKTALTPLKVKREAIIQDLAKHYGFEEENYTRTRVLDAVVFEAGKEVVK